MDQIVTDVSPATMARGIAGNIVTTFRGIAALGGSVREVDGMTAIVTGLPMSDFNGVFQTAMPPELEAEAVRGRLAATMAWLVEQGQPFCWVVTPLTTPHDLPGYLGDLGFHHSESMPGMALDLAALTDHTALPGLEISTVRDTDTLRVWFQTSAAGFGSPESVVEMMFAHFSRGDLSADRPELELLGRVDGTPVATAVLSLGAGVAGLYNISTRPEYRGRGIGAAMTLAALREARARGYRIGVLEASQMGFPVYQRLGFREYLTVSHFTR
ncbi:MAG: GNAT family N-acetyltransferase [Ktedonobacterales bacterium]